MIVGRTEVWAGRTLLVVLMVVTIIPFLSLFTTALHPSGSVPPGLEWPSDPQWGNFLEAFDESHMAALLVSSIIIVLGVVPASVIIATMAGFAIGHLRIPGLAVPVLPIPPRADIAASRDHHPALLLRGRTGHPQHQAGHHPAAHRAVHALRRLLDAGTLRQHAERAV